jgi:parallel beta helix pectate lyase-like protein
MNVSNTISRPVGQPRTRCTWPQALFGHVRSRLRAFASSGPILSGVRVRSHRIAPLALLAFGWPLNRVREAFRAAFPFALGAASPLVCALFFGQASAATVCVSTTQELSSALSTAASNGEDDTIQVVRGSYGGGMLFSSTQSNSLTVNGGYAPGCGSRTVDPANTILDAANGTFVLALASSAATNLVVDGLTLRNGSFTGNVSGLALSTQRGDVTVSNCVVTGNSTSGDVNGAGISIDGAAIVLVEQTVITDNTTPGRGAGVYVNNCQSIQLQDCQISGNVAAVQGGGVYTDATDLVKIQNCQFSQNQGNGTLDFGRGGGVTVFNAQSCTIKDSTFSENEAGLIGGAVCMIGGAAATLSGNTFTQNLSRTNIGGAVYYRGVDVNILNNVFVQNHSDAQGMSGGAVALEEFNDAVFTGNTVDRNTADVGMAVLFIQGHSANIDRNVFRSNRTSTSAGDGGALYVWLCQNARITNNLMFKNQAVFGPGAALHVRQSNKVAVVNNTFAFNEAETTGGAAYVSLDGDTDSIEMTDNIFWKNSAASGNDLSIDNDGNGNFILSTVTLRYNDLDLSSAGTVIRLPQSIDSTNLDSVDPVFVDPNDPNQPDFHLQSTAGSYHGGTWLPDPALSSLIDAGDPALDFTQEPQPNGGRIELGAFGNTDQASLTPGPPPVPSGRADGVLAGWILLTGSICLERSLRIRRQRRTRVKSDRPG